MQNGFVAGERWRRIAVHAIGGLTDVGFLGDGSRLLVASHQGRGEFDVTTCERVARDGNEDASAWFDESGPSCLAVSRDEWVPVAGLAGGSLPTESAEWRIVITGNEASVVDGVGSTQQLSSGEEIRVAGFAPNGDVLVVGCPSDLSIFRR